MKQILRKSGALVAAAAAITAGVAVPERPAAAADCVPVPQAVCGTIRVPLIRAQPELGTTTVAYALLRHRDTSRTAAGTVAVNPGGPGQSPIASAAEYAKTFHGLLADHDLLLVDPRGVNRSDPATCDSLAALPPTRDGFRRAIAACGTELGPRSRAYTSAEISDDIDAVRVGLGVERLDLLGESYGTYLMTVYAQRHPTRVRSMVLSSAYPLDFDLWARPNVRAARRAIGLMCERSAGACDGEKVLRDVARLSTRLRAHPLTYPSATGEPRILDDTALAGIVYSATAAAPEGIGLVPAAVGAALRGDSAPLTALARETAPMSGSSFRAEEEQPFNAAVAASVMCNDYPTQWTRSAPVQIRLREYETRRARLAEETYWPFGKRAWTSSITDQGDSCIRWPDRSAPVQPTDLPLPDVPVLVVSGDMDANTPTESGRQAARPFPRATVLEVPNIGHVAEREPSGCVAAIETAYFRDLRLGDTSCLTAIPPVPVTQAT
jgi:pimeloyl-ACP methyl ester carboxylesterase